MRIYIFILILLACSPVMAQSYTYSYIEPCSGKTKSIVIPYGQNNVTVNYYGNVNTFNANDFNSGIFSSWMNSIAQINSDQPCGEITTVINNNLNMTITQNIVATVMNITSIASMTQTISGLSSTMGNGIGGSLGNSVNNSEGSGSSSNSDKKNKNIRVSSVNNNSGSNSVSGGQAQGSQVSQNNTPSGGNNQQTTQTNQSGGENPGNPNNGGTPNQQQGQTNQPSGGTPTNGVGQGSTNNGGNTGNQSGTPGQSQENSESGKLGGNGNTANSISNAEDNSGGGGGKKDGGKNRTGSLIGTGDIVALKNAEDPNASNQFRFTASLTRANTDNTRIRGALGNFTTEINNTNLTLYSAWVLPRSQWTLIGANSTMLNFERDIFNTTTALASKRFKGNWKKLTAMGGLNYTIGRFGESKFSSLSAVGGGFYSFNASKKISGSVLLLAVYSPFTQFYDGQWWKSSTLVVPFSSWDYAITKTFRFNVSFSGVYEVNKNFMNYQVLTGGKILF